MKQQVVIIGSGWAGSTLSKALNESKFSITIISPETTTPYTPLLASAACGLYDYSLVSEPIRHTSKHIRFLQATVDSIEFEKKLIKCIPSFKDLPIQEFDLQYDIVVIAPGCTNNTFGTPGVEEHALFVRNVRDAQTVGSRIQDCFEKASIPGLSDEQQRALLHFVIVGAGPTGVEISSEISDLFSGDYAKLYPHIKDKVKVAVHDVADQVLSGFDKTLQEYAMGSFRKHNVEVFTGSHIEKIEKDCMYTKEKGKINTGLVIWATGNKSTPLVDTLQVKKTPRNPRILTNDFLQVYNPDSELLEGVFALGDAADVENARLPTTAEVACQKANYLAQMMNDGFSKKFAYKQTSIVAYLGQNDGVISGKNDYSGKQAWLAWRSKNFTWTRTWRQKILMVFIWILDLITGRSIAPR